MTTIASRANALHPTLISVAVAACFCAGLASANPIGPQVVNGAAAFQNPNPSTLSVTNSPGAIINWQGFSIGASEITRFIQQSSSSTVLNRVVGGDVSQIYGQLLSNGRVFLVNPGGILVGPGAIVDTAGFVASTLNMVDADFLAGKLKFSGDASSGSITNQGWIRTGYGGKIVLVAPHIENSGLIHTPGGELILAAGQKLTVSSLDHEGVQFEVQAPADSVVNLGKLLADGGAVGVFAGTLKHSGDIRANSLVYDQAGQVVLQAASDIQLTAGSTTTADGKIGGSVTVQSAGGLDRVAGTVSAQGSAGKGGDVRILGDRVAVVENAVVNASGSSGGGQVLIGGDFQGGNAAVQNASSTLVGAGAAVRADATGAGDGGRIIVWSDDKAQFYGSLSAQGGPLGGNGGFAEVSGKQSLVFAGNADLGAPQGKLGSLLLDPLDLYVDAQGALNPDIINENTDFPSNAATVSPDTLANIVGNVTLYASRYLRISSAVDLTTTVGATPTATPGKGLTAEVGNWSAAKDALAATDPLKMSDPNIPNRLDIGANITTAGGAVSLTAAATACTTTSCPPSPQIQSFGSPIIKTSGGAVSLSSASSIYAYGLTIDAGSGAVTATTGTDNSAAGKYLYLGAVTGGSLTATVPSYVYTGNITTSGGAVSLTSSGSSVSTGNITAGSGNVTLNGVSYVSSGTIDTTGSVALTASQGSVYSKVNNAASISATATNNQGSASVDLTSDTVLNAATATATTTYCSSFGGCGSASVSLSGKLGVNVGTVSASAPVETRVTSQYGSAYEDQRFEYRNSSVDIYSSNGPINASGSSSQITANNVYLETGALSGGGIGSAATPLKVDVTGTFSFIPNGGFNTQLNGAGPNALGMQVGVAPTGQTYTGSLTKTGQINLAVSATDATVTASTLDISSGFDTRVYNTSPSIYFYVPNGSLVATTVNVPKGDQVGIVAPSTKYAFDHCTFSCPSAPAPTIESLPVSLQASTDLTVTSYARAAGTVAKSTDFSAFGGSATLGTINASLDSLNVYGSTGVSIPNLTHNNGLSVESSTGPIALGNVTLTGSLDASSSSGSITFTNVSATAGASAATTSGNITLTSLTTGGQAFASTNSGGSVTLGSVVAGTSGVTITAPSATIQPVVDSSAPEVTSGGTISINAKTIGASAFANPLDLAGATVSLTSNGGGAIGFTGAPVLASTQNLIVNAANGSTFNVSTGATDIKNLTLTANPVGVGNGGLARIASNGTNYDFASDGTGFTLGGSTNFPAVVPAAQFAGGTLSFTAASGGVTLKNLDFSAGNGNFSATTNGNLANITQAVGETINLGTGTLTLKADGNVALESVNAGGMSVANATSLVPSGCNSSFGPCGVSSFTANQTLTDTANGNGTWSVTSRGAITTGVLQVAAVGFTTNATGNVTTGAIGTNTKPATSVSISTTGSAGNIQTGAIEGDTLTMSARGTIAVGGASAPANINAVNTDAATISLTSGSTITVNGDLNASSVTLTAPTAITTGNINAAAPAPASITFNSTSAVNITTGSLDANSIVTQGVCYYCAPANISVNGAIGANTKATTLTLDGYYGSLTTVSGAINMDPAANTHLYLHSGSGAVKLGGPITSGTDSNFSISAATTLSGLNVTDAIGAITAGNGSSISLYAGNGNVATPFQFTSVDAGASGSVTITAPAGIVQTLATASGGGVTAGTVSLSATSAGSTIQGPGARLVAPLMLRETSNLTLNTGGDVALDRSGAAGVPLLSNLVITRSDSTASFSLGSFAPGQTVGIANDIGGGGVFVDLINTSATPLAFRYQNSDPTNGTLTVTATGIATKGGSVRLDTTKNLVTIGAINTKSGSAPTVPDGSIQLYAGQTLSAGSSVDSGESTIYAQGTSITGAGPFVSTSGVTLYAFNGNIGVNTAGGDVQINAPTVSLTASGGVSSGNGNVYAALTGTTGLTIDADEGFRVSSTVPLTTVDLTTEGTGRTGPVTLTSTGAQSFGLARNGAAIDITGVASTSALSSFELRMNTGDLTVKGGIAADTANLSASGGTLTLDGSTSALTLSNATQTLAGNVIAINGSVAASATASQSMTAYSSFAFNGKGTLSSGAYQNLASYGTFDLITTSGGQIDVSAATQYLTAYSNFKATAAGGPINITSTGSQNIFAYGNLDFTASGGAISVQGANQSIGGYVASVMTLQGGASTGQSVTFTGTSQQNVYTYDNAAASIKLLAGSGSNASASIVYTGTGTQYVQGGNIVMSGNGPDAAALITTATGDQRIRATQDILLTGGGASGAVARIENTGAGKTQRVGEAEICTFCSPEPYQTDNIVLQGGTNAEAAIVASGLQKIQADLGIQVKGGSGSGGIARIENTSTSLDQRIGCVPGTESFNCYQTANTLDVIAGTGGAFAQIKAAGVQRLYGTSNLVVQGNNSDGGYARVSAAGGLQRIQFGNTTLTAGQGAGSNAEILYTGTGTPNVDSQSLFLGTLGLSGGGAAGGNTAVARISSSDTRTDTYAQRISAGGVSMSAGAGPNSVVEITTAGRQYLSFFGTSLIGGGAGSNSYAQITATGAQSPQTLYFSALTMTGGTGSGAYSRLNALSSQSVGFGTLNLDNGAPTTGSGAYVKIDTTGTQSLSGGNLTLRAAGTGAASIANAGVAIEGQSQTIGASLIQVTGGSGTSGTLAEDAVIRSLSGDQSISAYSGLKLDTKGVSNAEVSSAGKQTIYANYVDVITSAGSTGNAKLSATDNQWIRTTGQAASPDPTRTVPAALPAYGVRAAAFGTGTASIESGKSQLLEVTYPNLMVNTSSPGIAAGGLIVGGTSAGTAVAGTSRIKAIDQTIFAGTIWVETGLNASAPTQKFSEIKAANDQVITTLNGPIRILGGAGNDTLAQIDPVNQTIVVNGGVDVIGGAGTNAIAQILSGTGAQTLLATNGDVALTGGTGVGANALITSGGLQTVGASGAIILTSIPGGGSASISPLGNVPVGCAAPCILTTAASGGAIIAETLATNPVVNQLEELVELTDTTLVAEDTTILTRRAPICR